MAENTFYHTPHIKASVGDFAKTVLMPGDPMRAKRIADGFLENPVLVNNIRGVQGYTGYYDGMKISVMASGMGMPSIAIYSYELYNLFGVENIMRIGSAGSINNDLHLHDIVIASGACTDSSYASNFNLRGTFAPIASFDLLKNCVAVADEMKLNYKVGNVLSTDAFYHDDADLPDSMKTAAMWGKMGVLAFEMEAAALYMNAARAGKNALAVCTVSDHILTGESTTSEERQNSFVKMIELALKTAKALEG